jgi:hypothetical protein
MMKSIKLLLQLWRRLKTCKTYAGRVIDAPAKRICYPPSVCFRKRLRRSLLHSGRNPRRHRLWRAKRSIRTRYAWPRDVMVCRLSRLGRRPGSLLDRARVGHLRSRHGPTRESSYESLDRLVLGLGHADLETGSFLIFDQSALPSRSSIPGEPKLSNKDWNLLELRVQAKQ